MVVGRSSACPPPPPPHRSCGLVTATRWDAATACWWTESAPLECGGNRKWAESLCTLEVHWSVARLFINQLSFANCRLRWTTWVPVCCCICLLMEKAVDIIVIIITIFIVWWNQQIRFLNFFTIYTQSSLQNLYIFFFSFVWLNYLGRLVWRCEQEHTG